MKFRTAFAALSVTVALAACGELPFQKSDEPAVPAHSGPPSVSPIDQPIETSAETVAVATAEARTMGTAIFRASGAGWAVTAGDKLAVFERAGQRSVGVTVRRITYGNGVEFAGVMNGAPFTLNVQANECQAADGKKQPFSARVRAGSQRMTGCAEAATEVPTPQVRASSSTPKPRSTPKPAAPKPAETKPAETTPAATETTPTTTTPSTTTPATTTPAVTTPSTTAPAATPSTTTPSTGAASTPSATGTSTTTPEASTTIPPATTTMTPPATTPEASTTAPETTTPAKPPVVLPAPSSDADKADAPAE
ncbi:hypothetical protein [Paracoccus sulfuroxidans]|uniref:Uncharacterized protein n=1 Tax=Paracoccus sulfuroxidans TaxID=384678 RepID=A0A562NY68_9RHOB|nr:hypothetical protein [Paracoccus sulfuroxidans]TWI37119.1 hypothetical protein IQ24_00910 [Paracoccus sulfuroxidans]